MKSELSERAHADLRRTLGDMESLAPLPPELEAHPIELLPPTKATPRPFLVSIGAAAAVFALVLPIALLSRSTDAGDASPSVSPPSQAGTTAPALEPTASVLSGGWAITDIPSLDTVIGTTEEGFIAIATNVGELINVVRTSEDGATWESVSSLGEGAWAFDVERHEGTLVAAGAIIADDEGGGRTHSPAVWTSTDNGVTWNRSDLAVTDVTTTPDGFVAVGTEKRDESDPTFNKTQGVVWTSHDGLGWTRVATTDDPDGTSSAFSNVVWNGQIVILGHRGPDYVSEGSGLDDSAPHENITWYSDGTDLSDPVSSNLEGYLDANQTAVTPYGIVSMTHWMTPTVKTVAAAWISTDGTTWTELSIESGDYEYTDISQIGAEVFITGYSLSETDSGIWSTLDGTNWTRFEVPEIPNLSKITQIEVSESALVFTANQISTGIMAGRPRS